MYKNVIHKWYKWFEIGAKWFGNDSKWFGNDSKWFGNDSKWFGNDAKWFENDAKFFGTLPIFLEVIKKWNDVIEHDSKVFGFQNDWNEQRWHPEDED